MLQLPLPLVPLCDGSLASLQGLVFLARSRTVYPAIARIDGTCDGLEVAIEAAFHGTVRAAVMQRLRDGLSGETHPDVLRSLESLFQESPLLRDQDRLPLATIGSRIGALRRHLANADLPAWKQFQRIARIASAYELVSEYGLSRKQVAHRVGRVSVDTLRRDILALTGDSTASLMRLSRSEVVEMLASRGLLQRGSRRR
jgi:hypothetical protein